MKYFVIRLLAVCSLSLHAAENAPSLAATMYDHIVHGEWRAVQQHLVYLPKLDPSTEFVALECCLQNRQVAIDIVAALRNKKIDAHIAEMEKKIAERKIEMQQEQLKCEKEAESAEMVGIADIDSWFSDFKNRAMKTAFESAARGTVIEEEEAKQAEWWWWQRDPNRAMALQIVSISPKAVVWEQVTSIQSKIASMSQKDNESIHAYLNLEQKTARDVLDLLQDIKVTTWKEVRHNDAPNERSFYIRRKEAEKEQESVSGLGTEIRDKSDYEMEGAWLCTIL